jgi:hypothetical protein
MKAGFSYYTLTGELYDAFNLVKTEASRPNTFVEFKDKSVLKSLATQQCYALR